MCFLENCLEYAGEAMPLLVVNAAVDADVDADPDVDVDADAALPFVVGFARYNDFVEVAHMVL